MNLLENFIKKFKSRFINDENEKDFISYCKNRWPNRLKKSKKIVLIDLMRYPLLQHGYAAAANALADVTQADIGAFTFATDFLSKLGVPQFAFERIYEAFRAPVLLRFAPTKEQKKLAKKLTLDAVSKIKNKHDLLAVSIEGMIIGDFIYDSYLRKGYATVDLKDQILINCIYEGFIIYFLCKEYFSKNEVVSVLSSHAVYNSHGIITRYAMQKNIPLLYPSIKEKITFFELSINQVDCPEYLNYRKIFSLLPAEQQLKMKEYSRKILTERFSGKIDSGISYMSRPEASGVSGYGLTISQRILKKTDKPKILVLMSCFFDSPHCFRSFLFPDFWEWIVHILKTARETDFEWYIKPHPTMLPGNEQYIEMLKKEFPEAYFIPSTASNLQLIHEGVCSMFTTYGTAGHEFAYLQIPTVNAGDNPHIMYNFNFHPKSVEEFTELVRNADKLKIEMNKDEIEEYVAMANLMPYGNIEFVKNPITQIIADNKINEYSSESLLLARELELKGEYQSVHQYFYKMSQKYIK